MPASPIASTTTIRFSFMSRSPPPLTASAASLLVDHLQGRHPLGGAVRIALVGQHLVLLVDLALLPGPFSGKHVDRVRIAVVVIAAAEAVLALELVHLAREQ